MTDLFQLIDKVQPSIPGWCSKDKAYVLASLVLCYRPALTVEIGIYGGVSFIPLALAHKAIGSGRVMGIEPWDKHAAILAQTTNEDREWWESQDFEGLCQKFMQMLHQLGLDNVTKIIRKKSDDAEVPNQIGLLHVDAGHNDQAVRDTVRFAQQVIVGGFTVLDDLAWAGGAVTRAEQRLLQLGFRKLYTIGTGALYQRIR